MADHVPPDFGELLKPPAGGGPFKEWLGPPEPGTVVIESSYEWSAYPDRIVERSSESVTTYLPLPKKRRRGQR